MYNMKTFLAFFYTVLAANHWCSYAKILSDNDQCKETCADSYFMLPKGKETQNICQRGCRFFNILYLKDDHDVNNTKNSCFKTCGEAYKGIRKTTCKAGCDITAKKKESELSNVYFLIEQDKFMLVQTKIDLLDPEIASDPIIQGQIEIGYKDNEYKIPETKIRTMPIVKLIQISEKQGDWLDCASRNSGIPKIILVVAIFAAIALALWLSITSERRVITEEALVDEQKLDICSSEDEDEDLRLPCFHPNSEVQFSDPPKYSLETEKV